MPNAFQFDMMNKVLIDRCLAEHEEVIRTVRNTLPNQISKAAAVVLEAIDRGNTVFLCGNGGSAADAQHIAAEFTGRFVKERRALPAVALTTDTSALTAIGNDYGFESVYSRQIEALGRPGDLLIAISTSGESENVLAAVRKANEKSMVTIGLSGKNGGRMSALCAHNLIVPSNTTARIQEAHILIGHIFCEAVDERLTLQSAVK